MTAGVMTAASGRPGVRERFVLLAAFAFLGVTVLAGPLRMVLSLAGLLPLIYVPNLMLVLAIGWQLVAETRDRGLTPGRLVACLLPCHAIGVALQFLPTVQVAMGFYVLLPFVYGIACGRVLVEHWSAVSRVLPSIWLLVVAGVLVNLAVDYPWEGFGYRVGSLEVEGSRQWYAAGGGKRLAGFARASFDAAVQVQIAGILLALHTRSTTLRVLIWTLTIAAILPTNSKGVLLACAVVTPVVLLGRALPELPLRALPLFVGTIGIALPTATLMYVFDSPLRDPTLANVTHSFYDRLNYMWPEAWTLLAEQGHWLLGRGVGGIGTAQTYFEPAFFNAGDNLFMYWFVVFGWAALPVFVLLLLRSLQVCPHRSAIESQFYCLLVATLVYGAMTNIVENAVSALICGLLVRWLWAPRPVASLVRPTGTVRVGPAGC